MALLDSMESILDSLRDSLDPSESNSGNPREEQPASYREALAHYRTELLEHLADQKKSVQDALPVVSTTEIAAMQKKMDTLSVKLNRLRQQLKDLES